MDAAVPPAREPRTAVAGRSPGTIRGGARPHEAGGQARRRGELVGERSQLLFVGLDGEFVGRDVVEKLLELGDLRLDLLLRDLLALELDRRLLDHVVRRVDRSVRANRESNRVRRSR